MPSDNFHKINDVDEESQNNFRFIFDDEITYKKPDCNNIVSKLLERLKLKTVCNENSYDY